MAVSEPVEIGRIVRARERIWMVTGVDVAEGPATWVTLESLQDDSLGQTLEVLKEREADFEVLPEEWLHDFEQLDTPEVFDSFLYALRWQTQSLLPRETIRKKRISIEILLFRKYYSRLIIEKSRVFKQEGSPGSSPKRSYREHH